MQKNSSLLRSSGIQTTHPQNPTHFMTENDTDTKTTMLTVLPEINNKPKHLNDELFTCKAEKNISKQRNKLRQLWPPYNSIYDIK